MREVGGSGNRFPFRWGGHVRHTPCAHSHLRARPLAPQLSCGRGGLPHRNKLDLQKVILETATRSSEEHLIIAS